MKRFGRYRQTAYAISEAGYIVCSALAASIGYICSIDLEHNQWLKTRPFVSRCLDLIQQLSLFGYIALGSILLVCLIYRRMGNPWLWEKIKFILDEYQNLAFNVPKTSPQDHHRVTLFCHKRQWVFWKRHWSANNRFKPWGKHRPFSCFVVPVLRSGHQSQASGASFYTCDSSDDAEGLAGKSWAANRVFFVSALPEIKLTGSANVKARSIKAYAASTKCDPAMIQACYIDMNKPVPRSIAAIPISVSGRVWGTLVLDSRDPNGISQNSIDHFRLTVALIGHLLEKA